MKLAFFLAAVAFLLLTGCRRPSQVEVSLQPYTNIPPGTVVIVQMRIQEPREMITTNVFILEGFTNGSVVLRNTYGLLRRYPGSMIKSIKRKGAANHR